MARVVISELILGGEIMKSLSAEVLPGGSGPSAGNSKCTIVIRTVRGDIHDVGKDIVGLMPGIGGCTVHDLGTDVPVEDFVAAVEQHDPDIVGPSGLPTLAFDTMKSTVEGIAAAGLRDEVKIMIGGTAVSEHVRAYAAANGWGDDACRAVKLDEAWTNGDD